MKRLFFLLLALFLLFSWVPASQAGTLKWRIADGASETPEPADGPAPAPTPEPAAVPTPGPAATLEDALSDLLEELGQSETDPWRLAIYEAGAEDVTYDGEELRFFLRSFNPGLNTLGDYEADRDAYLDRLLESACGYDLEIALVPEDGEISQGGRDAVKAAVSQAAAASRQAFDQKAVRVAIANWLFPAPADDVKSAEDMLDTSAAFDRFIEESDADFYQDSELMAPLFYGQKKQTLDVSGGPHALLLECAGPNPEELADSARAKTLSDLARQAHANEMDSDAIREAYLQKLAAVAYEGRGAAGESFALSLDVDELAEDWPGGDYIDYVGRFDPYGALGELEEEVWELPDYPALDFPKTGRLSGSTSGTKVIVKAPDDGYGRYIQLRDYETDEVAVTFFIRSGGSCTVRVRKGDYYFLIASGEIWYGEEELFGEYGDYSSTDLLEVAGSNYYHTVTLETTTDGNMSVYGADPDSFRN